jgi:hypothetical protein
MLNTSGELALRIIDEFPGVSDRKLARVLFRRGEGHFRNTEHARSIIRYYRGSMGDVNRAKMTEETIRPRMVIPKSDATGKDNSPLVLTGKDFPIAIGADVHFPYHDETALQIFIERIGEMNAKTIIFDGDVMDCYALSRFCKDPTARKMKGEIEMVSAFFKSLRAAFPNKRIIYKLGNHEDRWEIYLRNCAPELYGLPFTSLSKQLDLEASGIELVESRRMIKAGRLYILHGHETGRGISSPVNPARGLYLKTKMSALCAHFHQATSHQEKSLDDSIEVCWSIGCLCDMKPEYAPVNKWSHGFAEVYGDDDYYHVKNRTIINGKLI